MPQVSSSSRYFEVINTSGRQQPLQEDMLEGDVVEGYECVPLRCEVS